MEVMSGGEASGRYWFHAKRYGWGWGLPSSWQGWVVLALFVVGMTAGGIAGEVLDSPWDAIVAVVLIASSIVGLLVACFRKGEPPQWRWGT
jgi:phosphate/sulfate permease